MSIELRMTRDRLVAANITCLDRIEALAAELGDSEWSTRSLCPEWTVGEVFAHVVGIEEALLGWVPNLEEFPPFDKASELISTCNSIGRIGLLDHMATIFAGRRAELERLNDLDVAADSLTPVGAHTYGRFLAIRVFDIWVHERDIAIPLDRSTDDGGDAAEITVDEIERSIGYIVGKKIGLPDQMSIRFDLQGPVARRIGARVDGRAAPAPDLTDPDVLVTADSTAFVMLACGRVDPQAMIDEGRIAWSGDDEWGDRAARSLAFTF